MTKAPAKKASPKKEEAPVVPTTTTKVSNERKEIELLDAEFGKGKGFLYKHDEDTKGVRYTYEEAGAMKCRLDGTLYVSVFYRSVATGLMTCTTAERWRARFTRVRT